MTVRAARPGTFPCGRRGAGCSATYNKVQPATDIVYRGGQGAACGTLDDVSGVHVVAITVVNAVGMVIDRDGHPVRGAIAPPPRDTAPPQDGNTTITVIATDARLNSHDLRQWGRQVHASMSRVIYPFHTTRDGDTLFAVSSGASGQRVDVELLGMRAADLVWDAVVLAVSVDASLS